MSDRRPLRHDRRLHNGAPRAIPAIQRCQVITGAAELACPRPGFGGHPRRLCRECRAEHQALYRAYKESSREVDRLLEHVLDAERRDPSMLTLAGVESAITQRQLLLAALRDEIRGRERHQKRFIAEPDDGHVKWLQRRRNMRDECSVKLGQLLQRQYTLLGRAGERQSQCRGQETASPPEILREAGGMTARSIQDHTQGQPEAITQTHPGEHPRPAREVQDERDSLLGHVVFQHSGYRTFGHAARPASIARVPVLSREPQAPSWSTAPRYARSSDDLEASIPVADVDHRSRGRTVACFWLSVFLALVILVFWVR